MSTKKKLLIIDDEPVFREMLDDFFTSARYEVQTAATGEAALDLLKQSTPDLILLDIQMPGMGGLAFFNQISAATGKSKYPVIIITARVQLEDVFKDLPVDGFVTKPVKLEELLQNVQSVLIKKHIASVFPQKLTEKIKKIMVVENDKEKFDQIVGELVACGFLVCGVKNGAEALMRAPQEMPDVVLTKLGLPDIFGDTLATQLKELLKPDAKIVVYAAHDHTWDSILAQKICEKANISKLIESDKAQDLSKEILRLFE